MAANQPRPATSDSPIPYASIERHGVIGDRRTAALIAADGTLDWLCLPRYDSEPLFGALLDARKGGYFRFGPAARVWGQQRYREGTALLETRYRMGQGELVAVDAMLLPEADDSADDDRRVRQLSVHHAPIECVLDAQPTRSADSLSLFCSRSRADLGSATTFTLRPGEQAWAVLAHSGRSTSWTPERSRTTLANTARSWLAWSERLQYEGPYRDSVMRSLITIRLLGYAPAGSTVAAPTSSLPERIGGDWNADYRLGIWELSERRDHVTSRVASWVAMARAGEIADTLGQPERAKLWRTQMEHVQKQVLERGYSEHRRAFRQEYGSDGLDASALLIPILGFLPGDDPRVESTVDAIARDLTIEGHVYRFVPDDTAGVSGVLGDYEGSFTLCTCWLAAAYALGGRANEASDTLEPLQRVLGSLGLFAEGVDARSGEFLGNYPLLFSHAEYIRAVTEFARLEKH